MTNSPINVIINSLGIQSETKDDNDVTLLSYDVFKSNSPKLLRFENFDLSGPKGKNQNSVLFHHNDKKSLAGYELTLYDQPQTNTLISLMDKVGTLVFTPPRHEGAIELDENGKEVKDKDSVRMAYRVWENKNNGLSYFLTENGSGQSLVTKLIVLKRSTTFGKDWITTLQLDWYKMTKVNRYKMMM